MDIHQHLTIKEKHSETHECHYTSLVIHCIHGMTLGFCLPRSIRETVFISRGSGNIGEGVEHRMETDPFAVQVIIFSLTMFLARDVEVSSLLSQVFAYIDQV